MHFWSLDEFVGLGYEKGRSRVWQIGWLATSSTVFKRWWLPSAVRVWLLRRFGANVAGGVLVRHGVDIHWPWKLTVGQDSWIGHGAQILNLEPVTIGANVCISQDVTLCTGSHDRRSPTFEFDNGPIVVEDRCWIAIGAMVLRGVTVGTGSVVGARALVIADVPADSTVVAPPAEFRRPGEASR